MSKNPKRNFKSEAAVQLYSDGFDVIPLRGKITVCKWQPWLDSSSETVSTHWLEHPEHDIGCLTDQNLIVFDCDTPEALDILIELEAEHGADPALVIETAKGEHHYFWREDDVFARQSSAKTTDNPHFIDVKTGHIDEFGILKRSMVVMAPSEGKKIVVDKLGGEGVAGLTVASQAFIDAVFLSNGLEIPRPRELKAEPLTVCAQPKKSMTEIDKLLAATSSNIVRDEWLQILMALHHEFEGSAEGLQKAVLWSSCPEYPDSSDEIENYWQGFNADGSVTIASLYRLAQEQGVDLEEIKAIDLSSLHTATNDDGQPRSLDDDLLALVDLRPMQRDALFKELAEKHGCSVGSVREEFKVVAKEAKLLDDQDSGKQGRAIEFRPCEPWPDPVDGAEVLDEALALLRKYMVISEEDAITCVLWAMHCHMFREFSHTPRLMITAPTRECGKTLLMTHLVGSFLPRVHSVELLSPAVFFRVIEKYCPTLLIDEADMFIETDPLLLAALNAGLEPQGGVMRCVGDEHDVEIFSTFAPVAIAGIDLGTKLPDSLISRCVIIDLQRASPKQLEGITAFDKDTHEQELLEVGYKMARFIADNAEVIKADRESLPKPEVLNRLRDKWRPLNAIANAAGGTWPKKAKTALRHNRKVQLNAPSIGIQLLESIRKEWPASDKKLATYVIIDRICGALYSNPLVGDEPTIWAEYNGNRGESVDRRVTSMQLAELLKPFGLESKSMRFGEKTLRGYARKSFEGVWESYLKDEK